MKTSSPKTCAFTGKLVTVAALGLLLAGCGTKQPPLRVGINSWPGYEFLWLAHEKGFFRDAGVEVKLVQFGSLSDARRAFESGNLDGWATTVVEVLMSRDASPRDARIVRVIDASEGADVIIAPKSIQSPRDLRGIRVGVELASLGVYMLGRALELEGLTLQDVTPVSSVQELMGEQMRSGALDAAVSYPPQSAALLADARFHAIFSSQRIPGEVVDVLAFDSETLRLRSQQVAAFQQALDRAFRFYQEQPMEAARIMGLREGLSAEDFQTQLTEGIRLITPAEQASFLRGAASLRPVVEGVARHLNSTGLLSARPGLTDCLPAP